MAHMAAKSLPGLPGFGRRLKAARELTGLSQPELAHRIGVNPSEISRWERDATFPRAPRLRELCLALHTSADRLLGLAEDAGEPEPEALTSFRATRWGKLAEANGWIDALRRMRPPFPPTVDFYKDIVKAMLDLAEPDGEPDGA